MGDTLTPEQRRRCMASVRSKDTTPEMVVRRLVHGMGYRYRLHVRSLHGSPDLVFPARQAVIFVHGCFWHRHGCNRDHVPSTNAEYWTAKLNRNQRRDRRSRRELRNLGWHTAAIWECSV
ncbi:DNA mismatch endonuclease Vsr, partial [Candidatus Sumerlaeota bacterium]|nr:DNA mismatch endonuclease Vsr [Candidatus Sumerlaeota bacterium]